MAFAEPNHSSLGIWAGSCLASVPLSSQVAPRASLSPVPMEAPSLPQKMPGSLGVYVSLRQPQRSCICVPGPFLCIGNLHSFTCGHVPAYRVLTNPRTGVQMAFGTPHMCACHFHTGASPHETTCHICGCCPTLCAGRLVPMQPTAFLLELQAYVGMPRSQVCVCVCT